MTQQTRIHASRIDRVDARHHDQIETGFTGARVAMDQCMSRPLTMIIMVFAMTSAFAGTAGGPTFPNFVTAQNNNVAYVYFQGTRSGTPPACAASIGGNFFRYAIDTTTTGGRAQLAILLAANATGANVWFAGTGTCNVDSSNETLLYAQSNP